MSNNINFPCIFRTCTARPTSAESFYVHLNTIHLPELERMCTSDIVLHSSFLKICIPMFELQVSQDGGLPKLNPQQEPSMFEQLQQVNNVVVYDLGDDLYKHILSKYITEGSYKTQALTELSMKELSVLSSARCIEHLSNIIVNNQGDLHAINDKDKLGCELQHLSIQDVTWVQKLMSQEGLGKESTAFAEINVSHGSVTIAFALNLQVPSLYMSTNSQNTEYANKIIRSLCKLDNGNYFTSKSLQGIEVCKHYTFVNDQFTFKKGNPVTHLFARTSTMNDTEFASLINIINNSPDLRFILWDVTPEKLSKIQFNREVVCNSFDKKLSFQFPDSITSFYVVKLPQIKPQVADIQFDVLMGHQDEQNDVFQSSSGPLTVEYHGGTQNKQRFQDSSDKTNDSRTQNVQTSSNASDVNHPDDSLCEEIEQSHQYYTQTEENLQGLYQLKYGNIMLCQNLEKIIKVFDDNNVSHNLCIPSTCDSNEIPKLNEQQYKKLQQFVSEYNFWGSTFHLQNQIKNHFLSYEETEFNFDTAMEIVNAQLKGKNQIEDYEMKVEKCAFKKADIEMTKVGFEILRLLRKTEYMREYLCKPISQASANFYKISLQEYVIRVPSETDYGQYALEVQTLKALSSSHDFVVPQIVCWIKLFDQDIPVQEYYKLKLTDVIENLSDYKDMDKRYILSMLLYFLQECHRMNICNLGLHPGCIYINDQFVPKVADWGNSQSILIGGKLGYQPPEQLVQSHVFAVPYDLKKVDSFAYGVILHEFYHGEKPFEDEDFRRLIDEGQPLKVPNTIAMQTGKIGELLRKLLETDPQRRIYLTDLAELGKYF